MTALPEPEATAAPGARLGRGRAAFWMGVVALYGAMFLASGYTAYSGNHAHQLPIVYYLNDPSLYAGDPFAETLERHPSVLWRAVAALDRALPLGGILFGLFLLERALQFYAVHRLAAVFFPRSAGAPLAAMAWLALFPQAFFGGGSLVHHLLEQTALALPCFLLALAAGFRDRPVPAAIWFAVGVDLNSLYGLFALSYGLASFLAEGRLYVGRLKAWGVAVGLGALMSLPGLALSARAMKGSSVEPATWLAVARAIFPYHVFPSAIDPAAWARYGVFLGAGLGLLWARRAEHGRLARHATAWGVVSLGWIGVGVAGERLASMPIAYLQTLRASDIWVFLASVSLIGLLAQGAEQRPGHGPTRFYAVGLLAALGYGRVEAASLAVLAALAVAIGLTRLWPGWLARRHPARLGLVTLAVVIGLDAGRLSRRMEARGSLAYAMYSRPSPPVWEFVRWAEGATAAESVFLVHPMSEIFRATLRRPVFVLVADAGAMWWWPPMLEDYLRRLQALGLDLTDPNLAARDVWRRTSALFSALEDADVERLARTYRLDYWVTSLRQPSGFAEVHRNELFKVLAVPPAETAAPASGPGNQAP